MSRSSRARPPRPSPSRAGRALESYYLVLTPALWLFDVAFAAPVRVAGIPSAAGRGAYYAGLVGIGLLCRLRPRVAPVLALLEGSANLLLLILSVLMPIWALDGDPALSGASLMGVRLTNFVLVAPFTVWAIKRAERDLLGRPGAAPPGA